LKKSQTAIAAAAVASLLSVSLSSSAIAAPDNQVFERQESSLQFFQDAFQVADVVCGARRCRRRAAEEESVQLQHSSRACQLGKQRDATRTTTARSNSSCFF